MGGEAKQLQLHFLIVRGLGAGGRKKTCVEQMDAVRALSHGPASQQTAAWGARG